MNNIPGNTELIYCTLPDISMGSTRKAIETQTGRALLFSWIANKYGVVLTEKDISCGVSGKPFLTDSAQDKISSASNDRQVVPVHFNISHSGKYVVCAISSKEIGCDIQEMRCIRISLLKYLEPFKSADCPDVKLMSHEQRVEAWVKYESLGKLIGIGIPFDTTVIHRMECEFQWSISHELPGYSLAICWRTG